MGSLALLAGLGAVPLLVLWLTQPTAPHKDALFWFRDDFADEPERRERYANRPWLIVPSPEDDLGVLYAVIKATRPRTLVEFGFAHGDGARAMLSAADPEAVLFSVDPYPQTEDVERIRSRVPASRFELLHKRGEDVVAEDFRGRPVEFAFLDASHELRTNQALFRAVHPLLSRDAVVAVHDTGVFGKAFLDMHGIPEGDLSWRPGRVHGSGPEAYYLHPIHAEERRFVNWLGQEYPDFAQIHLHTLRYANKGVTLLQRARTLEVPES